MTENINYNPLYNAQKAGIEAMHEYQFPRYTKEYSQSQEGWWQTSTAIYSNTCYAFSLIAECGSFVVNILVKTIQGIAYGILWIDNHCSGGFFNRNIFSPIARNIYPLNRVNNHFHFIGVSRRVEKFLGDWIFYPLSSGGMFETKAPFEQEEGGVEVIDDCLQTILENLKRENADLLQCELGEREEENVTKFDYRLKTVQSEKINAFACPGGGMVVFKGIANEIANSFYGENAITETRVRLADGTIVIVDLREVKKEDVLATLLGHEMTHAASRHSMAAIFGGMVRSLLFFIGRIAAVQYLKQNDKEYVNLKQQQTSYLNGSLRLSQRTYEGVLASIKDKERSYVLLNDGFIWLEDKVKDYCGLLNSRDNEYEADITGAYFAEQAGYNSLGALYLQEFFSRRSDNFMQKHFEFLFTHPHSEKRKRALLAGLQQFAGLRLAGRVEIDRSNQFVHYNEKYLSPAVQFAKAFQV